MVHIYTILKTWIKYVAALRKKSINMTRINEIHTKPNRVRSFEIFN